MMGAAINIVPLMVHRSVPGIGPYVLPAYLLAVVPAVLAALAYAILASAMPRAGGSYIYVSRSLSPYLGFVASFSQWFGLSVAIGVVAYVLVPFLRDIAETLEYSGLAALIADGPGRIIVALVFLWTFIGVNLLGLRLYERILVPLMVLMFLGGTVVIVAGFSFGPTDFAAAVEARDGVKIPLDGSEPFHLATFLSASVILFSSFIGFDAIAQAGGESRNPGRDLPLAIGISVFFVGAFYLAFTAAVYHAIPWAYVAERARLEDLTAPGLLGYLLSPGWTVAIVGGAAIALVNDLPAMLLAVSRLMFAWAEDGIFPAVAKRVHPRLHTPHVAILLSGAMATAGVVGSHLAGDFFLGIDILVTAMLVNFMLVCLSAAWISKRNPILAGAIQVVSNGTARALIGLTGATLLGLYLVVHLWKDLQAPVDAWYLRSTWIWAIVMIGGSLVFAAKWHTVAADPARHRRFEELPPE
jgi:amino acid transporter